MAFLIVEINYKGIKDNIKLWNLGIISGILNL